MERTYLETRTCGCGIVFKVLPDSKQYDCGRTHCKHAKLPEEEKKKRIKASFRGTAVAVPETVYPSKISPTTWDECVEAAKICVVRMGQYRMFIAEMAVKACEIKHGGGGHWSNFVSQHTLKDFANEIGMHQKTLYEWVAAKRNVVDKLPPKLAVEAKDPKNYKQLREARQITKKDATPEEATANYRRARGIPKCRARIKSQAKYFRNLAHSMSKKSVRDEADLEDLEIILNGAIDCVAYLKTYVKVRKRKEGVRE